MPVALVTGSSRGIGAAVAERFAADGHDVVVNYHTSADAAAETAVAVRGHGQEATVVGADVSDPDDAARLVAAAVEDLGGLDHVVNNAGIDQHVYTESLDPADFDRVMDVNVNSVFNVTKAALPHLRESDAEPTPSVTNVSSILAYTGAPIEVHYAGSKGALLSVTKSHARDFAPDVRVNALAPGYVKTAFTEGVRENESIRQDLLDGIPQDRFAEPEEIAGAAVYLASDAAGYVTGEVHVADGGIAAQ